MNDDLDLWFECLKNGDNPVQYLDTLFSNIMITREEQKQVECSDKKIWSTLLSDKVKPSKSMQFCRIKHLL